MSSRFSMPLRALATQTAVITMIGLGLAAPASAAPGDTGSDKRNDTATTAKAEASEKKTSNAAEQSRTRTEQSGQSSTKASATASTKGSGGSSTSTETKSSGSTKSENKGLDDDRHAPMGEQPVSNADQNTGGANGQCSDTSEDEGYFCGTTRNKASGNGKGDGEAVGKPYQAHKGKADNKNPPGQSENDNNNGYECDGNEGIAKGNPAHTSCDVEIETETTPPGPPTTIPPGIGGVDTEVPPAVTPPVVKGVETLVPPQGVELYRPPAQAAPAQVVPGAAALPATGATPAMTALSALALGMLALGSGLLLYRRVTS